MKIAKAIVAAAAILVCLLGLLIFRTPSMPGQWRTITPGMARAEVLHSVPDAAMDMRELKGFDVFTRHYRVIVRPCVWQMMLYYNENGEVAVIDYQFTDPNCGLFNKRFRIGSVRDPSGSAIMNGTGE